MQNPDFLWTEKKRAVFWGSWFLRSNRKTMLRKCCLFGRPVTILLVSTCAIRSNNCKGPQLKIRVTIYSEVEIFFQFKAFWTIKSGIKFFWWSVRKIEPRINRLGWLGSASEKNSSKSVQNWERKKLLLARVFSKNGAKCKLGPPPSPDWKCQVRI